jgi:hypothetical protein
VDRTLSLHDELHLRAAVERLARDGCTQSEIEAIVARMLGRRSGAPSFATRLRRFVGR